MTSYTLNKLKSEIERLKAHRDELLLFAEQACGIFNDYEIYHLNKGDETKAARNRCYKEIALKVIAKAKGVDYAKND